MHTVLSHSNKLKKTSTVCEVETTVFWCTNIILPLLIAVSLYIMIHKDGLFDLAETYCSFFHHIRARAYHEFHPKGVVGFFVKYQLGDFLWAYSLECSLILSSGNLSKVLLHGIFWASVAELFQLFPFVNATFDIWDMIAQIVGVVIAYIVVRRFNMTCIRSNRKIQK